MSLHCGNTFKLLSQNRETTNPRGAYVNSRTPVRRIIQEVDQGAMRSSTGNQVIQRKVEISVSPYDTAWVAMVPAVDSFRKQSQFPECLDWILKNQNPDGSWASHSTYPLLIKDSLSSTLACILALRKWDLGQQLVNKGLDFISSHQWAATDKYQLSPIGFDIIFPGMLEQAKRMELSLPIFSSTLDAMLKKRELEVQSALSSGLEGRKKHLAYVAEGLTEFHDWKDVMKYQRNNGSLFNSPSTTAAALLHLNDDKCFMYLNSLLQKYQNGVPTIYPLDIFARLSTVDDLVNLGIDQYFRTDVKIILDEIYRCWLQGDDEIFSDITCLAMAFRHLRINGYKVSSDALAELEDKDRYFDSVSEQCKETNTILELYKASLIPIRQSEPILDKIKEWTSSFLKLGLANGAFTNSNMNKEVEFALRFTHGNLDRLENRKSIELYKVHDIRLLKTAYRFSNMDRKYLLDLSVKDYNACQHIQQKEVNTLKEWLKSYRLDELKAKYERQTVFYGFFAAASILFSPEHSVARISWAKLTSLVTLIDDFYDFGASLEEQINMLELIRNWDHYSDIGFCSEQNKIIFLATYETINELSVKGSRIHGRRIKEHLIQIWLRMNVCMHQEYLWTIGKPLPSMDEYIEVGFVTIGLGPTSLIPFYFTGCKLSEEVVMSDEYETLYRHTSTVARLLNDLQSVEREYEQGKLNSVLLRMVQQGISKEEAVKETENVIDSHRRELLRMAVEDEGSIVPKPIKDQFWKTTKIVQVFYNGTDGFSSQHEMDEVLDKVIYKQILLPQYSA